MLLEQYAMKEMRGELGLGQRSSNMTLLMSYCNCFQDSQSQLSITHFMSMSKIKIKINILKNFNYILCKPK